MEAWWRGSSRIGVGLLGKALRLDALPHIDVARRIGMAPA
jgi:hypothetical protein